jgi:hypothetical protein
MKKRLLLLSFVFVSLTSVGQYFEWVKRTGSVDKDFVNSMHIDEVGNIYTTGRFEGKADFNPGKDTFYLEAKKNFYAIYLSKLDASGNFIWAKIIDCGGSGRSIVTDRFHNVYVTGNLGWGTVDIDPGAGVHNITSIGSSDAFILKLDSLGNFVWARNMGGINGSASAGKIIFDKLDNLIISGPFQSTVDFDPGVGTFNLTSSFIGYNDIYIAKYSASGNFIWAKRIGGYNDEASCMKTIDSSGNIYLLIDFTETIDMDPGKNIVNLTSKGGWDFCLLKLDSSGKYLWVKQIGGISDDHPSDITIDHLENIYITGSFRKSVDIGSFSLSANGFQGLSDFFVAKLNSSGNFVWVKQIGGPDSDWSTRITLDDSGNIYLSGNFSNTVDFNPDKDTFNLTSDYNFGTGDLFILKLNAFGKLLWAKNIGGQFDVYSHALIVKDSNIYIAGEFYGMIDFDPGFETYELTGEGERYNSDIFILKLNQKKYQCNTNYSYSTKSDTLFYEYLGNSNNVKWSFGNGKTSKSKKGTYVYGKLGLYMFCLKILCSDDSTQKCVHLKLNACKSYFTKTLDTTQKFKLFLVNKSSNTSSTKYHWDFGDGDTSALRNPTHKYRNFGKFFVCLSVTDNSCSSKFCDTLGLDSSGKLLKKAGTWDLVVSDNALEINKMQNSNLKIYPNPATNKIFIEQINSAMSYDKIEIINSNGQKCISLNIKINNDPIEVNIEKLITGIYLVKVSNDREYIYTKIIKN